MTLASRRAESGCCAYFNHNNNYFSWRNHPVTGEINKRCYKRTCSAQKYPATVLIKKPWDYLYQLVTVVFNLRGKHSCFLCSFILRLCSALAQFSRAGLQKDAPFILALSATKVGLFFFWGLPCCAAKPAKVLRCICTASLIVESSHGFREVPAVKVECLKC